MTATLILPSLVVSKESIDFGTCLVGQTREMQFTLENPSASASYWAVSIGKCIFGSFGINANEPMQSCIELCVVIVVSIGVCGQYFWPQA